MGAAGRSRSCEEIPIDVPVKYVSKERSVSSGVHFGIERNGKDLMDDGAQLARWLAESLVLNQRPRVEGVAANVANNRSRHDKYLNNGASKEATIFNKFPYKLRGSDATNSSIAGMPPTPAETFVVRRNSEELNRMRTLHADIRNFAHTRQLGKSQLSRRFQAVNVSVPHTVAPTIMIKNHHAIFYCGMFTRHGRIYQHLVFPFSRFSVFKISDL